MRIVGSDRAGQSTRYTNLSEIIIRFFIVEYNKNQSWTLLYRNTKMKILVQVLSR